MALQPEQLPFVSREVIAHHPGVLFRVCRQFGLTPIHIGDVVGKISQEISERGQQLDTSLADPWGWVFDIARAVLLNWVLQKQRQKKFVDLAKILSQKAHAGDDFDSTCRDEVKSSQGRFANSTHLQSRLDQLFVDLHKPLYRIARSFGWKPHEISDLIQAAWDRVLALQHDYDDDKGELRAWAIGIAKIVLLENASKRKAANEQFKRFVERTNSNHVSEDGFHQLCTKELVQSYRERVLSARRESKMDDTNFYVGYIAVFHPDFSVKELMELFEIEAEAVYRAKNRVTDQLRQINFK